ncbi:DUF4242 domain-containing protein [Rothia kristinae]|uniref:DUF4242 domain-containing protein n=1 Tax=Rothia kristinae TaxID=37923 RepID=A0A7T3CHA4_9MICC|nr:DUF4242 domain-containing protein [Rothia kristinae]MED6047217.1 DUF4242 domain-containing protein [Rothia kristinae]QPT54176.1 DUF4242 domain-containing protein [Rothia kristinae]TDP54677.1 uncharacterized protein DUF4242 [Kocuria sp. AG109]
MALHLLELTPHTPSQENATALLDAVAQTLGDASAAELIESQVTADHTRLFVIVETDDTREQAAENAADRVRAAVSADAEVTGPDAVRLVGAELSDIKKLKKDADYLVEWDIPAEITMDQYLTRKKANAPKYAEVPEVSFLRTYVREDTVKCLCFYDAPDEEAVTRARQAVDTPIDRLFRLRA